MEHTFTATIKSVLERHFKNQAEEIFEKSLIVQYINEKTRSANKGSKSRASFANLYAIYILVDDYLIIKSDKSVDYLKSEGAKFSNLITRQRKLPFGSKLQNHALNNRLNAEFQEFFPNAECIPILRNLETNRYWINESLLKINVRKSSINIAKAVIEIIDEYVKTKQGSFDRFVATCN